MSCSVILLSSDSRAVAFSGADVGAFNGASEGTEESSPAGDENRFRTAGTAAGGSYSPDEPPLLRIRPLPKQSRDPALGRRPVHVPPSSDDAGSLSCAKP